MNYYVFLKSGKRKVNLFHTGEHVTKHISALHRNTETHAPTMNLGECEFVGSTEITDSKINDCY
jgi:hypothetical protein